MDIVEEEESAPGSPAWMATFADLMSLLMCFFVLLLSFSEMDVQKYKLVAGSMKNAFGIQREIVSDDDPTSSTEQTDNFQDPTQTPLDSGPMQTQESQEQQMIEQLEELIQETNNAVSILEESLEEEIGSGFIELESGFRSIVVRIKERGSFGSGSAELQEDFLPVMDSLRTILKDIEGQISIEGHTDNIDIRTTLYPSNWALSSARALSVAHELLRYEEIPNERFVVVGHADTLPVTSNETPEGRASNRRVEIVIKQEVSEEVTDGLRVLEESNPEILQSLQVTSAE